MSATTSSYFNRVVTHDDDSRGGVVAAFRPMQGAPLFEDRHGRSKRPAGTTPTIVDDAIVMVVSVASWDLSHSRYTIVSIFDGLETSHLNQGSLQNTLLHAQRLAGLLPAEDN